MISATEFVQEAGISVLRKSAAYCESMKTEFNRRRLFVLERMRELGMDLGYTPTGAFYVLYKYRTIPENLLWIFVMKCWKKRVLRLHPDGILALERKVLSGSATHNPWKT